METLYYEIGQRIQHLRHLYHMTQENLAEKLDVSVKHISAVERGLSKLSIEKLIQTADIFDCTIDYLVLGKAFPGTDMFIPRSVLDIFLDSDEKERELLQEYILLYKKIHD